MLHVLAICLSFLASDEVNVKPLHGETMRGSLVKLSEKGIVLQQSGTEQSFEASAIQSVKPATASGTAPADNAGSTPVLELMDDSMLPGTNFQLSSATARFDLANGFQLKIPGQLVRGVRFRKQDEALKQQWQTIAEASSSGDRLIVRKTSGDGPDTSGTVVLDQLEGVVHEVDGRRISFEFDGDKIDVPLEKVEGILFHHRQKVDLADAVCRVRDLHGGEWNLQSVQLDAGKLSLKTVGGAAADLSWKDVLEVDFSSGNLTFLSDLKEESSEWRPYLFTPATPPALSKWFRPRRDQATDGSVLTLGGRSFEKGLAVHSRTLVTYRLTRDYRHFQALVGIDERFKGPGNLRLEITGDTKVLLSRDIRGNDAPFEMDLDITGVRRLKILVDFGEDRSDAGDHLLLCNARLTK